MVNGGGALWVDQSGIQNLSWASVYLLLHTLYLFLRWTGFFSEGILRRNIFQHLFIHLLQDTMLGQQKYYASCSKTHKQTYSHGFKFHTGKRATGLQPSDTLISVNTPVLLTLHSSIFILNMWIYDQVEKQQKSKVFISSHKSNGAENLQQKQNWFYGGCYHTSVQKKRIIRRVPYFNTTTNLPGQQLKY